MAVRMTTMKKNWILQHWTLPNAIRSSSQLVVILLLLIGAKALAVATGAQSAVNSVPTANFDGTPKIAFVETEVFYGELLQGEVVQRDILIRNDGDADLKIWRANPSCGCTVIVDVPEMIPPGEIATVRIYFYFIIVNA